MVSIFKNDFLSIAGQKERLANVGNTLLSAVGIKGGGVQSNTGVKVVDTVLSATASHPFVTAGVVATATTTLGKTAVTAVAKKVGEVAVANPGKATLAGVAGLAVVKSEKGREAVLNTPSSINNFTSNVAKVIDNPSIEGVKNIAKENPVLTAGLATGLAVAGGLGLAGVASSVATFANTKAIKESTNQTQGLLNEAITTTSPVVMTSSSPVGTPNLASPVLTSKAPPRSVVAGGARRARRKKASVPSINNNIKVYNIDDRDNNDRKVYKR